MLNVLCLYYNITDNSLFIVFLYVNLKQISHCKAIKSFMQSHIFVFCFIFSKWTSGSMVLSYFPVPGRTISLDESRTRAYCGCSLYSTFVFFHLSALTSFPLSLGDDPI